ncbi:hypothetical protein CDAR_541041, partial [Caerostris darwini]
WSQESFIKT